MRPVPVLLACAALLPVPSGASLSARSALVLDPATGRAVYADDADVPRPPASTTKLMTALIAQERLDPDARIRVSAHAASMPRTKANLQAGRSYRAGDLLTALLVGSCNDAAVALAEGAAGTEARFAAWMTERARELGCRSTRFVNASGLTHPSQTSSCRDLLRIYAEVRRNPRLMAILRTESYGIDHPGGGRTGMRNHNKLLGDYASAPVGKTGYTRAARHCFAGSFVLDGRELYVACMGSRSLWGDLKALTTRPGSLPAAPAASPSWTRERTLAVQKALAKAGFSPGPLDGRFGPATKGALIRFQKAKGLLADGALRDATRAALKRASGITVP